MGDKTPGLAPLKVIDRLEVGEVRLEARRMICPYTVLRGRKSDTFEFRYRFEEDVFDASDPTAWNIAGMMAAQVALNYGLFCDRIVFRGRFDELDQNFLTAMAALTARDIYVKKIALPTPFLRETAIGLPLVVCQNYLQAKLEFDDTAPAREHFTPADWQPDATRTAVLCSGGKDSLLSDAMLREIGVETHAIFVDESGQTWLTAVNAYRHFVDHRSEMARVWTNSDRLFKWMLRHLPFVRDDFRVLRARTYPIRLWTIAIFVFGAMPLLRKRNIGRLVIGNEYDTTERVEHQGITHHNTLFDQSRFYDQALTHYFQDKGWAIRQFSILRPLSEPLIVKMLAERYPEIQRLQVSCIYSHMKRGRVHPCGKCEKCYRLVTMLSAVGVDPTRCGFSPQQVQECLTQVVERGVKMEPAVMQHIGHLLTSQGLLPGGTMRQLRGRSATAAKLVAAQEQREVMQLRFAPLRSTFDDIPVDLRESLYRIMLEHAEGAVKQSGEDWRAFDLLSDPNVSDTNQ